MEIFQLLQGPHRQITEFGSYGVTCFPITAPDRDGGSRFQMGYFQFSPNSMLGMHPAATDQLFIVIEGSGWVQTAGNSPIPVQKGDAVLWRAGESHASGTDQGMNVIIFEAKKIPLFRSV